MLAAPDMMSIKNKFKGLICQSRMYSEWDCFVFRGCHGRAVYRPCRHTAEGANNQVKASSTGLPEFRVRWAHRDAWFFLWITGKQDLWCRKRRKQEDLKVLMFQSSKGLVWGILKTMDSTLVLILPPPPPLSHRLAESSLHPVHLLPQWPSRSLWASIIVISKLQVGPGYQCHHSHLRKSL